MEIEFNCCPELNGWISSVQTSIGKVLNFPERRENERPLCHDASERYESTVGTNSGFQSIRFFFAWTLMCRLAFLFSFFSLAAAVTLQPAGRAGEKGTPAAHASTFPSSGHMH